MKIEREALRSRVGRRIFLLFILCALVPITALATASFIQVTRHLRRQTLERLDQMSEFVAQLTLEKLGRASEDLRGVGTLLFAGDSPTQGRLDTLGFQSAAILDAEGLPLTAAGLPVAPLQLSLEEARLLEAGIDVVRADLTDTPVLGPLLMRPLSSGTDGGRYLLGRLRPGFLFHADADMFELKNQLTVMDHTGNLIYTSFPSPPLIQDAALTTLLNEHRGSLDLRQAGEAHVAAYWTMPLRMYGAEPWKVILSESRSDVLSPLNSFRYYFVLIVLVSLWLVLLLSINQIRRNLVPLGVLKRGTEEIAAQHFQTRVSVASHDEFEDLATSFNTMAAQLSRQFNTLTTIAELDRSVLSTLEEESIINTVLIRTFEVLGCDGITLVLFDKEQARSYRARTVLRTTTRSETMRTGRLGPDGVDALTQITSWRIVEDGAEALPFTDTLTNARLDALLLIPLRLRGRLAGLVAMGYPRRNLPAEEEAEQAKQIVDRFAVALSNARLLEDLDELSTGTLNALARAIDAKSSWTAGHSERVTHLSLRLAREMGLDREQLETLRRGGLLHDLGKIGIPGEILDKPGKLTDEERLTIESHTVVGARILEPIPAFTESIPIVRNHHECWDGSGYPDGLAGEDIDLLARVLSVADFYDALKSERPYRAAYANERVLDIIDEETGLRFDPAIASVFQRMMRSRPPSADLEAGVAVPARKESP